MMAAGLKNVFKYQSIEYTFNHTDAMYVHLINMLKIYNPLFVTP